MNVTIVAFVARNFGNKSSTARLRTRRRSDFDYAPVRKCIVRPRAKAKAARAPNHSRLRQVPSHWRASTHRSRSWHSWCAECMRWHTRCATCARLCAARHLAFALLCCPSTCPCTGTTLHACASARLTDTSSPSTTTVTRRRSELPGPTGIATAGRAFVS